MLVGVLVASSIIIDEWKNGARIEEKQDALFSDQWLEQRIEFYLDS